jgi:tetratricopeptide (TPR) repeat protein
VTARGATAGVVGASALVALSLASACEPAYGNAYLRAFAEASRDMGAGRLADAVRAYDEAAEVAVRARDRDEARWAAAETTAREGHAGDALRRFAPIASDPTSEHQAEAAYRIALLRIDSGDVEQGWSDMEEVARRYPTHGVAHVALRHLVEHADEAGPAAGLALLRSLERGFEGTELAQLVAYETARHLEDTGDDAGARAAYVGVADRWPYPFGSFFDDALWHASLLDEKARRAEDAVDDLERLLRERETTFLMGSYERPRYVPALMRVGALYRDRLNDHAKARAAFHRLFTDFAHSTMRDDALWEEAALWRLDGDARTACDRLGTLVKTFPDSRYVPCAVAECAGLTRPAGSDAPKDCHEYLTRPRQSASSLSSSPGSSSPSSSSSSSSSSNSSSSSSS